MTSLAWPAVVFGLGCIVWFSLSADSRQMLLDRLREAGPGGLKFDEAQLEQAGGELKQASQTLTRAATVPPVREAVSGEPAEMDTKTPRETQRLQPRPNGAGSEPDVT